MGRRLSCQSRPCPGLWLIWQKPAGRDAAVWIEPLYTAQAMDDDPFSLETARLVEILARLVRDQHVSVRSLEKKMGVGDSVFSKVLKGKITLHVRHILMICTALGIEWKDFFTAAYGASLTAPAERPLQDAEWEEKVIALLTRLGVLPLEPAAPSSAGDH